MYTQKISLVVAVSENGVIGNDNRLLWHLPNDLKHFKTLTMGKPIIMGRKTYEAIGKPLPGRQNIIVTRKNDQKIIGCAVVHSVDQALSLTKNEPEIMIVGGGEIYRLFDRWATHMYITYVHVRLEGDVSFRSFNRNEWQEVSREDHHSDDKHPYDYSFVTFVRRSTDKTVRI